MQTLLGRQRLQDIHLSNLDLEAEEKRNIERWNWIHMQEKNGESKETTCANVRNSNNICYTYLFFSNHMTVIKNHP
ncbi:unnamed protein product [Brassica rapa subsp. trilocularis]